GDAVLPRELEVTRGQRCAVGPHDARLEGPGDAREVLGDLTAFDGGEVCGEPRYVVAVSVVANQRFQHDRRGVDVLGAAGQVRVDDRDGLPVHEVDGAVATALRESGSQECQ